MKHIALALILAATVAQAETYPYEVAFNAHGFSDGQTATMSGQDMAVVWFITPGEGTYLVQVSNSPDSTAVPHLVVIVDTTGNTVAVQQGYYPSFYITIGQGLQAYTGYLMIVQNANANGSSSCTAAMICNVVIRTQPAS